MYNPEQIEKNKMSVALTLSNGEMFYGSIFISPGDRLQDIMNDKRQFIPIYHSGERKDKLVIVAKRYVILAEEI
jgi:hypothetical protein